jgi:hypothetical protein
MAARLDAGFSLIVVALVTGLVSTRACAGYPDIAPVCGSHVTMLTDAPSLATFPVGLQHTIMAALHTDILAEGRATGACFEGQNTDCQQPALRTALHLRRLSPTTPKRQLYLVWWYVPTLCGNHVNCPIWLVEVGPAGARNLVQKATEQNPGRSLDGGWGFAILPDKNSLTRLMIVGPTFIEGHHGAAAIGSCWHEANSGYESEPCPTICDDELNKQSQ